MSTIKKAVVFFVFFLFFHSGFAQFAALQINMEVRTFRKEDHHTRFSLYCKDSTISLLGIKHNPVVDSNDPETWMKRDADTVIEISIADFNKIVGMAINLSPSLIIKGAHPNNFMISHERTSVSLDLAVNGEHISYIVESPIYNTESRNLGPFLAICKEILLLAKLKPRVILK